MTPRKPASCVLLLGLCGAVAAAADGDEEATTARVQSTYVWQNKRPFPARYSGPNSLSPAEEISYTFTATAFLGLRPWKNGELYLTPELSQGVAMSNLTGLGGFPNGEANRAAGSHPKLYRQKLFLRQTWNENGETVAIEGGQNQLAGKASENRWVLTLGNFSVLDVFDGNRYAKDPRSQFFNWSAMTYAAYDYAADARGFGWGFALERHWRDWSLRLGRMSGPVAPNALPVDLALGKHYGDQIELERRYDWNGKPGAWRVLAWRNRAVLGRYDDALAALRANPGGNPQTIIEVRGPERIKYGLGVNLEQEFSPGLGGFVRAMKADGRTETYAFTEVDQSLALGVSANGRHWGRAQDTLGLAWMQNGLSRQRRAYLAAGGISYFIGDGALAYRPETIAEIYYNWNVARGFWVSFDWQRIRNPAYNADRGPVSIGSVRLHLEF